MYAYSHGGLASLDLVGAVLRQGSFVEKMVEMEWTEPHRFEDPNQVIPLIRSIARYHAFLDLMTQHAKYFLVPTLVMCSLLPSSLLLISSLGYCKIARCLMFLLLTE